MTLNWVEFIYFGYNCIFQLGFECIQSNLVIKWISVSCITYIYCMPYSCTCREIWSVWVFFNWMKHLTFTCAGCGWLSDSIILKNNCLDCELRGLWNNLSLKKQKTGGGIFTGTRRWNHIISSTFFFFTSGTCW